jgi:two-component system OmpR family response regulator
VKKKGRILVIDDNEAVLNNVRSTLQMAGYEVVATSKTVGTARHLNDCELVIIDYHMPGLHGGEVLSSLRAAANSAHAKPLFYLYTSDPEIEKAPAELGFDGVFTKKGNRDALLQNVDAAFRLIRLRALQKK